MKRAKQYRQRRNIRWTGNLGKQRDILSTIKDVPKINFELSITLSDHIPDCTSLLYANAFLFHNI